MDRQQAILMAVLAALKMLEKIHAELALLRQERAAAPVSPPPDAAFGWYDRNELMRHLHCSSKTITRMIRAGLLHPSYLRGTEYFSRAEIEELLRQSRQQTIGK